MIHEVQFQAKDQQISGHFTHLVLDTNYFVWLLMVTVCFNFVLLKSSRPHSYRVLGWISLRLPALLDTSQVYPDLLLPGLIVPTEEVAIYVLNLSVS